MDLFIVQVTKLLLTQSLMYLVVLPGQEFVLVGLQQCQLNTTVHIGSILEVPFLVWNNGSPAKSASTKRTLVIRSPCIAGKLTHFV